MHDRLDPVFREYALQGTSIDELAEYELHTWGDTLAMTFAQVVIDNRRVSSREKFLYDHAADVTSPAGDQDPHVLGRATPCFWLHLIRMSHGLAELSYTRWPLDGEAAAGRRVSCSAGENALLRISKLQIRAVRPEAEKIIVMVTN